MSIYRIIEHTKWMVKELPFGASITCEQIEKYFRDRVYGKVEEAFIMALFVFPYLTKQNMARYADKRLGERKWSDYSNLLNSMWREGIFVRYEYGSLVLYALSKEAMLFAVKRYAKLRQKERILQQDTVGDKLECAALAQWHISILCYERVLRSHFFEKINLGREAVYVPSYVEIKKGLYRYHVICFCMPKNEGSMERFIADMSALSHALKKKVKLTNKDIFLVVVLAQDMVKLKNMAYLLAGNKNLMDLAVYFSLEEHSIHTKGLDFLYTVKEKRKDICLELWEFRERNV